MFNITNLGACMEPNKKPLEPSKKPLNVLVKQLDANIGVVLKNSCEYKGKMIKCDGRSNA